jgi:hypothetical protein
MRNVVMMLAVLLTAHAAAAQRPAAASAAPRFFPIPPCRVVDTAAEASSDVIPSSSRSVDLVSHRCGQVVPPFATRYVVRVTTFSRTAPDALPSLAPTVEISEMPASSDRVMSFAVAGDSYMAVDVVGFYVPAGIPMNPTDIPATGTTAPPTVTAQGGGLKLGTPSTESLHDQAGTDGDIYLSAANMPSPFTVTGVLMAGTTSHPFVVAQTGNATTGFGSFMVYNTNPNGNWFNAGEIMRVQNNGVVRLAPNAWFDGRSDYFGSTDPTSLPNSPTSTATYTAIPRNIVHNVMLTLPRDSAGSAANRVTFFNASTTDETGSPSVTKFQASTQGYNGLPPQGPNINFDSQIIYHTAGQYHFRGYSTGEGKETFWVKAATDSGTTSGTRADMYVSGRVSVGGLPGSVPNFPAGAHALEVFGKPFVNGAARETMAIYDNTSAYDQTPAAGIAFGGKYNATDLAAEFASIEGVKANTTSGDVGGELVFMTRNSAGNPTEQMRIKADGTITIAQNINAKYQDVAEWVPASQPMAVGTVVVLNPQRSNEVMPSSAAYDTSVAGVVSDRPGLLLGEGSDSKAKIATTGRVKVRVDASRGAIHIGDLLVSSDKAGVAMRSEPIDIGGVKIHRPGTLIGKALEPLQSGQGEILVLLSLQ